MTSIANGESGLSVRTKLNAALAVTDAVSFATRAAFVSANTATPGIGLSDGQIAVAGGYAYRRLAASSAIADLAGWVPNEWGYFEQWGAVGDGSTNDQAAVQAALMAWPSLKGTPRAVYRLNTAVVCPSNRTIDLNGAKLRRGGTSQWMFETEKARTTWDASDITLINWNVEDDGTSATRGNFNLLVGDRIKVYGYKAVAAAPYGGGEGAWSIYASGDDIEIHDVDINSAAAGLFGDGIHVGHVRRLLIGAHNIRAGDDAIALYPAPRSYTWRGRDLASEDVTILPGFVSSADANCIRVGSQEFVDVVNNASPENCVWKNVNFVGETLGQCKTAITLSDRRTTSDIAVSAKNTGININAIFADQFSALRVVRIAGNPSVTNAENRTQHNFGKIKLNLSGIQRTNTGGLPGEIISGGGADWLELSGDLITDPATTPSNTNCSFLQIDDVLLNNVVARSDTTGTFATFQYVRRVYVESPNFTNDGNLEFQCLNIALNSDQDVSLYVSGGRINDTARVFSITGTGAMRDFHVIGTHIVGSAAANPNLSAVTSWTAGGTVIYDPAGGYRSTVSALFGTTVPVLEGSAAYATNGRKAAEGAGAGTGQVVYRNGTSWRCVRDDSVVVA